MSCDTILIYVYTILHPYQVTSNGGIAALSIIHPKDLVFGLDEKKQLQDLEGILDGSTVEIRGDW